MRYLGIVGTMLWQSMAKGHGVAQLGTQGMARLSPGEALRPQPGWRRQAEPLGVWSWPRKGRRLLRHIPVPTFHSHQQDEVTPAATTHPLGPVAPDGAEQSSAGTSASPDPKVLLESPAQGCYGQGTGMEGGQQDCTPHPRHILWGQNPAPCIPLPASHCLHPGAWQEATPGHGWPKPPQATSASPIRGKPPGCWQPAGDGVRRGTGTAVPSSPP